MAYRSVIAYTLSHWSTQDIQAVTHRLAAINAQRKSMRGGSSYGSTDHTAVLEQQEIREVSALLECSREKSEAAVHFLLAISKRIPLVEFDATPPVTRGAREGFFRVVYYLSSHGLREQIVLVTRGGAREHTYPVRDDPARASTVARYARKYWNVPATLVTTEANLQLHRHLTMARVRFIK